MRILSEHDVERLIEPEAAIAAMADAFRRHSSGRMPAPGRLDMGRTSPKGSVLVLAGHSDDRAFALKANMHVYPDSGTGPRKAASMMLLWDAVACVPRALIATTLFNNHRTAAGPAVAVQALAPQHAETLAVFGAGKIAPEAIRYLASIRSFKTIAIMGRGPERSQALAQRLRTMPQFTGIDVRSVSDAAAAVRNADVVVTMTTSDTPVFSGRDVKPGAVVVLAGANRQDAREADDVLMERANVLLDHRDAMERAGDIRIPSRLGVLKSEQIVGEIGELLAGTVRPTMTASHDVMVFKSMGIIAQDLALGELVVERAEANGVGIEFDVWGDNWQQKDQSMVAPSAADLIASRVS
jgi:ornithine cyclodeaminase/alanine dehydrogenase-like protein (mu-crystallin family)